MFDEILITKLSEAVQSFEACLQSNELNAGNAKVVTACLMRAEALLEMSIKSVEDAKGVIDGNLNGWDVGFPDLSGESFE
ncbi:MAG: hypothetical protein ACEQSU_16570 [Microgenomates group bacterium]|jgi:hypothetical protein